MKRTKSKYATLERKICGYDGVFPPSIIRFCQLNSWVVYTELMTRLNELNKSKMVSMQFARSTFLVCWIELFGVIHSLMTGSLRSPL